MQRIHGKVSVRSAKWLLGIMLVLLAEPRSARAAAPSFSTHQVISTNGGLTTDVRTADLDGDGDADILTASYTRGLAWYENNGGMSPSFVSHAITPINIDGAFAIFAARIDADNDLDLLSASFNDDMVAWYERTGPSPSFIQHPITFDARQGHDVWGADLDGDGDTDVLSASETDFKIAWYENNGATPPSWVGHVLTTVDPGETVQAADLDGDNDLDVVASAYWFENNGGTPPAFTRRLFAVGAAALAVFVADVNGDGAPDVLAASPQDDRIAWYANDGGSPPVFTPHVISTSPDGPQAVHAADVDADGDVDVLSASWIDNKIAWYENNGAALPAFIEHVITTSATQVRAVYAADVDADGDVDVISGAQDRLTLHLSDLAQPPCVGDDDCIDPLFCNGFESCGAGGTCEPGPAACTPSDFCSESNDHCVDCVIHAHCSDGLFCNGPELCDAAGTCQPGTSFCTMHCDEAQDRCVVCLTSAHCPDDGLFCNGTKICQNGGCLPGPPPCPAGTCNESTDSCGAGNPGNQLWVSFDGTVAVPDGVGTVQNEDIVAWDTGTGVWSLLFDGSDVGLSSAAIGGLARLPSGEILLSFTSPFNVPGLTGGPAGASVDDSDIVRFTPTSLGTSTAGSFSFYFDGSDVGLTTNQEVIDAIDVAADGRLVLSTSGSVTANGASAEDEDLLIFTASSQGATTAGTFAVRFDGSDVGLAANDEDLDAACDTVAGSLLLSTLGSLAVPGASGADEDLLRFTPSSLGPSTAGSYVIFLDTSAEGIATSADVSAVELKE